MNKYCIGEKGSIFFKNTEIGAKFPYEEDNWLSDTVSDAVENYFKIAKVSKLLRDPLVFAMNPQDYVVVLLTDAFIVTGFIQLDIYADLFGSLTFKPENLNNSDQKPEGSA